MTLILRRNRTCQNKKKILPMCSNCIRTLPSLNNSSFRRPMNPPFMLLLLVAPCIITSSLRLSCLHLFHMKTCPVRTCRTKSDSLGVGLSRCVRSIISDSYLGVLLRCPFLLLKLFMKRKGNRNSKLFSFNKRFFHFYF